MGILCSIESRINEKIKVNVEVTQMKSIFLKLKCTFTCFLKNYIYPDDPNFLLDLLAIETFHCIFLS